LKRTGTRDQGKTGRERSREPPRPLDHWSTASGPFPTLFPRLSDGLPTVFRRCSDGIPTVFSRYSLGLLAVFPRYSLGIPTVCSTPIRAPKDQGSGIRGSGLDIATQEVKAIRTTFLHPISLQNPPKSTPTLDPKDGICYNENAGNRAPETGLRWVTCTQHVAQPAFSFRPPLTNPPACCIILTDSSIRQHPPGSRRGPEGPAIIVIKDF